MRAVSPKLIDSLLGARKAMPNQRRLFFPHLDTLTTRPRVCTDVNSNVLVPARGVVLGVDEAHVELLRLEVSGCGWLLFGVERMV